MAEFKYLYLVFGIDVEEDAATFASPCRNAWMMDADCLDWLAPIMEKGARPTLFCSYGAFVDAPCRRKLASLRDCRNVEIGAHLHHWSTPPFDKNAGGKILCNVPAGNVPLEIMDAKLRDLFQLGNEFQNAPITSFRMGRFDMRREFWPLLNARGVLCDASVRPLRAGFLSADIPDHLNAPINPYMVDCGNGWIMEAPATVTPLCDCLTNFAEKMGCKTLADRWGGLSLSPVYQPLWLLKMIAARHASRGGQVLCLNWNLGAMSPRIRGKNAVKNFIKKITAFMDWLDNKYIITYATLDELRLYLGGDAPLARPERGDWTAGEKTC